MEKFNGGMKRIEIKSKFQPINDFVVEFIKNCGNQNNPINGPAIKTIAEKYVAQKKIENFKASNEWLNKLL